MEFCLAKDNRAVNIIVEDSSYEGVKRIADTVSDDICLVTNIKPDIVSGADSVTEDKAVLFAALNKSGYLDGLIMRGLFDRNDLEGKNECFCIDIINDPFPDAPHIKELLLIAGSDKRGTIYGMFELSKMCGVSPLVYFGDAYPKEREQLYISVDKKIVSKEPSVRYRGFFINDEWPAFGNWCLKNFGGVNAKAYDEIFKLLLRLKGNYMWPAMWNSSFSEDGPGIKNAELADIYGVVMGASHHEPMCRAGVEWQRIYSKYGDDNTWDFTKNEKAISSFWEDGIIRNRDFENVITLGMRGENDSKLMSEETTLADNIAVIKRAVHCQNELIKKHISGDLTKVPRMIAIYKEVEDYYFGDETCEGLKDWDELSDVIFLLSDDNFGNLRALPENEGSDHPGGFGMYYHFDYHGAPVSYEWTSCIKLSKVWDQMDLAYRSGVRSMWIVNVGDLKEMEYPLSYFMDLAYDYDSLKAQNLTSDYTRRWIDEQFADEKRSDIKDDIFKVLTGYTHYNAMRHPEEMNENVYHTVHYKECDRIIKEVSSLMDIAFYVHDKLEGHSLYTYESMIFYPAVASFNLILACAHTGINHELAKRGVLRANHHADLVRRYLIDDARYVDAFHKILNGKWDHCLSSLHNGFRSWDDYDAVYPVPGYVTPINRAKVLVSIRGCERFSLGDHWQIKEPVKIDAFDIPSEDTLLLDIDSRGNVSFTYDITMEGDGLSCDKKSGHVDVMSAYGATVSLKADPKIRRKSSVYIRVDISFDNGDKTKAEFVINIPEKRENDSDVIKIAYETNGCIAFAADAYYDKKDAVDSSFYVIEDLGREGNAVKVLPPDKRFDSPEDAPCLDYRVCSDEGGDYCMMMYIIARNPVQRNERIGFFLKINEEDPRKEYVLKEDYFTEWQNREWSSGVRSGVRVLKTGVRLKPGMNDIRIIASDPQFILEKTVLYKDKMIIPDSYLGMPVEYGSNP